MVAGPGSGGSRGSRVGITPRMAGLACVTPPPAAGGPACRTADYRSHSTPGLRCSPGSAAVWVEAECKAWAARQGPQRRP